MTYQKLMDHAEDLRKLAITVAMGETATAITAGHQPVLTTADPRQFHTNPAVLNDRQIADITGYFADVPEWFEPFSMLPDPASFDPAIQALEGAMAALATSENHTDPSHNEKHPAFLANSYLEGLTLLQEDLEDWTGEAADDFRRHFLTSFASAAANDFTLAGVLKSVLEAEKALWATARANIDHIAEKAITAMKQVHEMSSAEWEIMWAVVGAAIGIISIPLDGPLGIVLAVAGGVTGVLSAGAFEPPDSPTTPFTAGSSMEVISLTLEAVRKLTRDICAAEEEIAKAAKEAGNVVLANQDRFLSPRPALAGATANDITSEKYMGTEE